MRNSLFFPQAKYRYYHNRLNDEGMRKFNKTTAESSRYGIYKKGNDIACPIKTYTKTIKQTTFCLNIVAKRFQLEKIVFVKIPTQITRNEIVLI